MRFNTTVRVQLLMRATPLRIKTERQLTINSLMIAPSCTNKLHTIKDSTNQCTQDNNSLSTIVVKKTSTHKMNNSLLIHSPIVKLATFSIIITTSQQLSMQVSTTLRFSSGAITMIQTLKSLVTSLMIQTRTLSSFSLAKSSSILRWRTSNKKEQISSSLIFSKKQPTKVKKNNRSMVKPPKLNMGMINL